MDSAVNKYRYLLLTAETKNNTYHKRYNTHDAHSHLIKKSNDDTLNSSELENKFSTGRNNANAMGNMNLILDNIHYIAIC